MVTLFFIMKLVWVLSPMSLSHPLLDMFTMVTCIFDDLVWNEVEPTLVS
jgi:hypothetical protein